MAQNLGQFFQSASQALGIMSPSPMRSAAGQLGIGGLGERLQEQVAGETDEQRRRRLREQQGGFGDGPAGQASLDLFGGMGGLQY